MDKHGELIDFMLLDRRNTAAVISFPVQSPETGVLAFVRTVPLKR